MKKFLVPFLCYSIFVSLVIFCFGIFLFSCAACSEGRGIFHTKISNGLILLNGVVPSIYFTGFLLGCALSFGDVASRPRENLRAEIYSLFKKVMVLAIVVTVISLCSLVFLPYERLKQQGMRNLPIALNEYVRLSRRYLDSGHPEQASRYIQRAKELDPGNEEIEMLARRTELRIKENESVRSQEKVISYVQTDFNAQKRLPMLFDESEMSVSDMIEMARSCFADRNFFDAHYFAESAIRLCKEDDENYDAARTADESWRELQSAQMELSTDGNVFFRKKARRLPLAYVGRCGRCLLCFLRAFSRGCPQRTRSRCRALS